MKKILFLLLAAPLFIAAAGERYLIENAGKFGETEFEVPYFAKPSQQFKIVDASGKSVPQKVLADYAHYKRIRFSAPGKDQLFLVTGKPDGETLSPNAGEIINFKKLSWKSSIPQLARTPDGFAFASPTHVTRPYIESNLIDIPQNRDDSVIFEYAGISKSLHPWTIRIQILQFDKNGSPLPCCAVDERWLNFLTAPNKLQHIRQTGRLDRRAAKIAVRIHMHAFPSKDVADSGYKADKNAVKYPALEIKTFSLRYGKKCHPGGRNKKLFTSNGLKLDGKSGVAFNPAGAEMWSEGKIITDAREFAFPLEKGSIEVEFTPAENLKKYTLFDTCIGSDFRKNERVIEMVIDPVKNTLTFTFPGTKTFTFPAVVPANKRCRLTLDWNNDNARCFLNGKKVAETKLENCKFFTLDVKNNKHLPEMVGIGMSARVIFIDANKSDAPGAFMNGTLHAARFSNTRRGDFSGNLVCDDKTTAFFDYSKSIDGVTNSSARGFVSGVWYGREPLDTPIPYVAAQPQLPYPQHDIYNDIPQKKDFDASRVRHEKSFSMTANQKYVVECETAPRMEYIEIACPKDEQEIVNPLVKREGDIDTRSFATIRRDLKLDKLNNAQKASKIFGYLLQITDYFIQHPVSYPQPYKSDMSDYTPLAMINNYIGEDCGPQNFTTLTLFNTLAGFPSTLTAGNGHAFQQVFFDGSWQVWDLSAEQFMRSRDPRRAASLEELERDPYLFRLSDYFSNAGGFIRIRKRHNGFFPEVDRKIVGYKLRNGEKFRINWYNNLVCNDLQCAPHMANHDGMIDHTQKLRTHWRVKEVKWRIPPEFSTGVFICDSTPTEKPHLFKCGKDHFTYEFNSSHPMTNVKIETAPAAQVEYSFDNGKSFVKDPAVFVKGRRQIIIKVNAAPESIKKFSSNIGVQLNTRTLTGKLSQGKNELSIDINKGGKADVKIVWSEDDKPLTVEGALSCGAAKGWEKHLIVLDSAGKFSGKISGDSADTKLVCSKGISAGIKDGKLTICADEKVNNSLETLKITDKNREKTFAVLVSRNSRLHTAKNAKVRNGAKREGDLIKFTSPGQQAIFRQDKLPQGKYTVFVLFNMFVPHEIGDMRMLTLSGLAEDYEVIGRIRNLCSEFFIVKYSKPHFKWDFPQQGKYPYTRTKIYETRPRKKLILKSCPLVNSKNGTVCDVSAVLIADASDDDFVIKLAKYLTTLNGFPERF